MGPFLLCYSFSRLLFDRLEIQRNKSLQGGMYDEGESYYMRAYSDHRVCTRE